MKIGKNYVVDALKDLLDHLDCDIETCLIDLISDIEHLSASEWISVDNRLPEKSGFYIVFVGEVNSDFFDLNKKDFHHYKDFVTHWQPMPEQPKEA